MNPSRSFFEVGGLLLVAASMLGGCGALESEPNAEPGGVCDDGGDCPGAQSCRSGFCTVESARPRKLDFRFYPSGGSTLAQRARDVTVDPTRPLDFVLQPTVVAEAQIESEGTETPQPGRIAFTRSGGPPLLTAPSTSAEKTSSGSTLQFEAKVLPGRYDIRYFPEKPGEDETGVRPYPPVTWKDVVIEKPQRRGRVSISSLPPIRAEDELVQIAGQLLYSPGDDGGGRAELRGARVFAVGANNPTLESSKDRSDPQFQLNVLPVDSPTRFDLIVGPSPENPFVPRVRIPSERIRTQGEGGLILESGPATPSLQGVRVGQFPKISTEDPPTLQLEFKPADPPSGEGPEWSKFRIVLSATDLDAGTFSRTANLSSDGTVSIDVLPLDYEGWLLPPADAKLHSKSFEVDTSQSLEPDPIELATRRRVSGRVVDSQGNPIDRARVEFTALRPYGGPGSAAESGERSRSTAAATTDEDGRFSAWLEERAYRAVVVPPAHAGLPRQVVRVPAARIRKAEDLEFRVAPPLLVTGRVLGQYYAQNGRIESSTLSKTSIEVYTDRFGLETKIAEISSRSDGSFYLLLPGQK